MSSDCVMPQNRTRRGGTTSVETDDESQAGDTAVQDSEVPSGAGAESGAVGKHDLGPSSVTLSGLLNAIDGVASQVRDFLTFSPLTAILLLVI